LKFFMWYVYILQCSNGEYYKGCTSNIEDRLERHQKGWVESTRHLLPVTLVSYTVFTNQQKAYDFEKYLKSGSGRAFMKKHFL
jgi:predicted GIY-YIG superfamily endonuclease